MAQIQFETNLNCGGCVARAKATLDKLAGPGQWAVDTEHPRRVLSLTPLGPVRAETVIEALAQLGFDAVPIN